MIIPDISKHFQTTNQVLLIFMNKKKWFSHEFSGAAFVTSDISKVTFRCKATMKSSFRWPGLYPWKHANFTRKNGDLLRKTMCFKGQTKKSSAKWLWFGCQVGWNPNCCWVLWVTGIHKPANTFRGWWVPQTTWERNTGSSWSPKTIGFC